MDYVELKGKIIGKGFKLSEVSQEMGWERSTLSRKLANETLRVSDLEKIGSIIGIKVVISYK